MHAARRTEATAQWRMPLPQPPPGILYGVSSKDFDACAG